MKPKRNKVFCTDSHRTKIVFETEKKAENFIRFNADEMIEETGKAPVRCYYCASCGGWHVTSNPNRTYFDEREEAETFDLAQCHKWLQQKGMQLAKARNQREFIECYRLIEEGYIEVEKAEKAGVPISEFENELQIFLVCASTLHKACPKYNPRLNTTIQKLDILLKDAKECVTPSVNDYIRCKDIIAEMEVELKNAIRYGACLKQLKKYSQVCEWYDTPQKFQFSIEQGELYQKIVNSYRKKGYSECADLLDTAYQDLYKALDDDIPVELVKSMFNRLLSYKNLLKDKFSGITEGEE